MKIRRIILNDFRGFPGKADYEFKLDGRNMLLFGENGSGKSSVFVALREFFNTGTRPPAFQDFRNVFTADATGQPLTSGRVSLEFDDNSGLHTWDISQNVRPLSAPAVADAALRFGAVDYRAMLKTSFVHTSGYPNLFGLLVKGVLARMPVTAAGRQTTLGKVAEDLRKPNGHYSTRLRKVDDACLALNTVLVNHIPPLATVANQILYAFGDIGVTFRLIPPPLPVTPAPNPEPPNPPHLRYDRQSRDFANLRIDLVAQLHGHGPAEPQNFFNEARLTALALAIYLASIKMSIPPSPPGVNTPAKVIILDDVLIGLDMSNRQPLLDILTREDHPDRPGFADWQIILMTHDQAWYSLARRQVREWKTVRLAAGHNGQFDVPILYDDTSLIDRAELQLNVHGDERAAGVYLRLAFEEMLKSFCARTRTPIAFHRPDEHPRSTNVFWQPILGIRVSKKRPLIDAGLGYDVESCRSNVANPLCHYGNSIPLRNETLTAISVLRRLQTTLNSYPSQEVKPKVDPKTALENAQLLCAATTGFSAWNAAVHLRAAFDEEVGELAKRRKVAVNYSPDFIEFATSKLWNKLCTAPNGLTATHAAQVAGIHSHSDIFLQELGHTAMQTHPQIYFQAALAALIAPPTTPPTATIAWLDGVP